MLAGGCYLRVFAGVVVPGFVTACSSSNEWGECSGTRQCLPGGLSPCTAPTPAIDICDGIDNDCDGQTDPEEGCGSAGACCVGAGECVESYKNSCLLQGGTFQGTGVTCAQSACGGGAQGACCRTDGTCAAQALLSVWRSMVSTWVTPWRAIRLIA